MELWRDAPGYKGLYKVSDYGRIYSCYRNKIMKPLNKGGYLYLRVNTRGIFKIAAVHRLVAEAFLLQPKLAEVNHIDGNPLNNHCSNLEWVTHADNMKHASANGLFGDRKGQRHNQAKLTEKDVRWIRNMWGKMPSSEIALKVGVNRNSLYPIVKRVRWSHI